MRLLLSLLAAASVLAAPSAFADTDRSAEIRDAVSRSLTLLQRSTDKLDTQTTCSTCHNHVQVVEAATVARAKGIKLDEAAVERRLATIREDLELRRETSFIHGEIPGSHVVVSGVMAGVVKARLPRTEATDSQVVFLLSKQSPSGAWSAGFGRGSNGDTPFLFTLYAVEAIDRYAPPALRKRADASVERARAWFLSEPAVNNEGFCGKLEGLVVTRARAGDIAKARAALAADQRQDGGWAQEPGLASDAYATGLALVALKRGGMRAADPVYQRGVAYLLKTQAADGSWHVKTRAVPIQPPIDGGFPYGIDQWISAWGTALAAEALAEALP